MGGEKSFDIGGVWVRGYANEEVFAHYNDAVGDRVVCVVFSGNPRYKRVNMRGEE